MGNSVITKPTSKLHTFLVVLFVPYGQDIRSSQGNSDANGVEGVGATATNNNNNNNNKTNEPPFSFHNNSLKLAVWAGRT